MSNSQLNKLKSQIKNDTEVTLKLSSNVVGDSNDENNFPCKLLLTNTQVLRVWKAFVMVHHLIYNHQKLDCIKQDHQEDF